MKYTLRALLAVGLLIGFYVVCAAVLVLLGLAVYEIGAHGINGVILGKFAILVVLIALAMGRGLFGRRKNKHQDPGGLLVSEQEQPALWAEVRSLAERAQTRPPAEIRLVPEVNAAVSEDSKLLGLLPGTRRLYVGVPLLMGLTQQQFRSVLAHELGHYSGKHTAMAGLTYRGKESIGRVLGELGPDSFVGKFLGLYGRLFLAVSHSVNRRQELEADVLSAELVGPATASSALRELPPLDAAWSHFLESYVELGDQVGARASDLFDGFGRFLADPTRQGQLAEIRGNPQEQARSVYDTHPTIEERVRAFAAMPQGQEIDHSGSAIGLLSAPDHTLTRFQDFLYDGSSLRPLPFEQLIPMAAATLVDQASGRFFDRISGAQVAEPSLGAVIGLLREGQADRLLALPEGDQERKRGVVISLLGQSVAHALIAHGRASYQLDWGGPWHLVGTDGAEIDPFPLAEAAVASPEGVAALESFLAEQAIPLEIVRTVPAPEPASEVPTEVIGALAPVTGQKFRVLLVLDSGVLLRRPGGSDRWDLAKGSVTLKSNGTTLIRSALKRPLPEVAADPRSVYLPWARIAHVAHQGKKLGRGTLTFTSVDGGSWTIKLAMETETVGQPLEAIAHFLGERYSNS
jgi:Zn-dependent protease with chaperone function